MTRSYWRHATLALAIVAGITHAPAQELSLPPVSLIQGAVVPFSHEAVMATLVRGRFRDRPVTFFRGERPSQWWALLGADLADPPGRTELLLELTEGRDQRMVRIEVEVRAAGFGTQALTLPRHMVDLDAKVLARVNLEQARIAALLERIHPRRLWRGPFLIPVEGQITRTFGMRRLLNGQARNPHSGEDIIAPKGTPVLAAHNGIVRLVDDHFFSGKSVILDHGGGLFTVYFHLNESGVRAGAAVKRGEIIGKVGASGRVTGPHLHWGAVLAGARVNPLGLLSLPPE
jgi:murein DD-endopeptidase MepM/ murein hydrolase activator NlpD